MSTCKSTAEQITKGINKIKEERKIQKEEHKLIGEIHDLVIKKQQEAKEMIEKSTKGGSKGKIRKYRKKILFKKRRTRRHRRKI